MTRFLDNRLPWGAVRAITQLAGDRLRPRNVEGGDQRSKSMSPPNENSEQFGQTAQTVDESSAKQGKRGSRAFQIFLVSTGAAAVALIIAFVIATVAS